MLFDKAFPVLVQNAVNVYVRRCKPVKSMNEIAKPSNTPMDDIESAIELEIEELEKIVAPSFKFPNGPC